MIADTVASSLVTLAMARIDGGDAAAARPVVERAVEINERCFGPEHHQTRLVRDQLAPLGLKV